MSVIDDFYDKGKLGPPIHRDRRRRVAMTLVTVHKRGWFDPADGRANPLSSDEAAESRNMLEMIEHSVGNEIWPVIVRIILTDLEINDCADLFGGAPNYEVALLRRLCAGLDIIAPKVGLLT